MESHQDRSLRSGLPLLDRRSFLAGAGASGLALQMGALKFASALLGDEPKWPARPRIRAAFIRPDTDRFWMSWPGAGCDAEARQAEYTKTLTDAARRLGLQLEVLPLPVNEPESVGELVEQLRKSPPDGLILTVMHLKSWPQVEYILKNRPGVPTIVYSPLGTALIDQVRTLRKASRTFVAATPDAQWPASGMKLLKAVFEMKNARICMIAGSKALDKQVASLGTTLHYVPLDRWPEEANRVAETEEMRAIAEWYAAQAEKIVEPRRDDVLEAAKNYVVARKIMAAEKCQGVSVDCSPLVGKRRIACGPCLAWSKLLDEGRVGACEGDADAAVSLMLAAQLLDRPGFMQDAAPNTVGNTLIASHCTCPTQLEGAAKGRAPFLLRSHAESQTGVAIQVVWPLGREVTLLKFQAPDTMLVGTGRVVGNIESSLQGGCRTAVEVKVDGLADCRDIKGHHQVLVCGQHAATLRAFCELSGLKAVNV